MVWVSPGPYGATRRTDVSDVLRKHHMLWVGANNSGNDRFTWDRVVLALDAAYNMNALYSIDPNRIYVAGYSGGGRMASALSILFPEVFRGSLMAVGCDSYGRSRSPTVREPTGRRRSRSLRRIGWTGRGATAASSC